MCLISDLGSGKFKGEDTLLPCVPVISTDMLFELQFLVGLAFAMTINKVKEPSLQMCGLN